MRCIVTGANGFVGSHLVDLLLQEGHEAVAYVRAGSSLRWLEGKPITLARGTLEDSEALRQVMAGADVVFHVAGVVNALDREGYFHVNARGTRAVAEAFMDACPDAHRFVLVSSQSVVGPSEVPVTEQTQCQPMNLYGESKLAGEQEAQSLAPALPLSIARPGPIYGPRDREALPLFKQASMGLRVKVGFAANVSNFCHVDDVARGIMLCATRDEALGQTFMIGGSDNYTLDQLGRILVSALRGGQGIPIWLPVTAVYAAGVAGELWSRLRRAPAGFNLDRARMLTAGGWPMDISKARKLLGYEPRWDLGDGARQTVAWAKENGWM